MPAAAPEAKPSEQLRVKMAAEEQPRHPAHGPAPGPLAPTSAQDPSLKPAPVAGQVSGSQAADEQYTQYVISNYYQGDGAPIQGTHEQSASALQVQCCALSDMLALLGHHSTGKR